MFKIGSAIFPYRVFCAVGARGFFGEGYSHDRIFRHIPGCTWEGTNRAFKTVTLERREGNLPLQEDGIHLREIFPRSIKVEPLTGHVLNAVSWSNFGLEFYAKQKKWQEMSKKEAIVISLGTESARKENRLKEIESLIKVLCRWIKTDQRRNIVLHLNFGCPNIERSWFGGDKLYEEIKESLTRLQNIGFPIVVSFGPLTTPDIITNVARHKACSGLWLSNTMPWGLRIGNMTDWSEIFGSRISPLEKRGFQSGGVSGPNCFPFVIRQVEEVRKECPGVPIIAGNGIQKPKDAIRLFEAGANAIAIGTVKLVRPWRMRKIITTANQYCNTKVNHDL